MNRLVISFLLLLGGWTIGVAQTFYDIAFDGLFYKIINEESLEVEVCRELEEPKTEGGSLYEHTPEGDIYIPAEISADGETYHVVRIGDSAFGACFQITSISIPASVREMGELPFLSLSGLKSFVVDDANPLYCSVGGVLYSKDQKTLLCYPNARGKTFSVPEGTQNILSGAFFNCFELESITLPESLDSIGFIAFTSCINLRELTIPRGLKDLQIYAFAKCASLQKVDFKAPLEKLPMYTFDSCSALSDITLPEGMKSLGDWAFGYCVSLEQIKLPSTLEAIEGAAFSNCSKLAAIELPQGLKRLGNFAFGDDTALKTIKCQMVDPIEGEAMGESVFSNVWVDQCKLLVPEGSKERYAKASQWQEFLQIEETTGLESITRDLSKGPKPAIFTIQGEQIVNREELPAGIYIIDGVKTLIR
ncbi:leucine-rich repeat domain-containing protein [uncultured Porphyromonas sp.]|uniref:leucine-rich repeat domain-containing protein n=1 Tax=uncultured Porphyromonas sp. TaxID=159274 RepID=UPI00262DCF54|nr:leucine-rich repeat domain-containing protein [uncultured Porphyromonas sp.]